MLLIKLHFIENNLLLTLKVFDPGEVLYIYESPAGIGISVLRVIVSITWKQLTQLYLKSSGSLNQIILVFHLLSVVA